MPTPAASATCCAASALEYAGRSSAAGRWPLSHRRTCAAATGKAATVRTAARLAPADTALAAILRLLQLQAHHLGPMDLASRPGQAATQLGWEALNHLPH